MATKYHGFYFREKSTAMAIGHTTYAQLRYNEIFVLHSCDYVVSAVEVSGVMSYRLAISNE